MIDVSTFDTELLHNSIVIDHFKLSFDKVSDPVKAHELCNEATQNQIKMIDMVKKLKSAVQIDENEFFLTKNALTDLRKQMLALLPDG